MKCPRCSSELRTIDYEGARIETCPDCGGEWLDQGELKQIVQTVEESFPQDLRDSLDAVNKSIFSIDESVENQLSCPKCPTIEMNRFNYASSSGIALDKCPECSGIWLDKDELEHVQVLVEEWHRKLEEDIAKFGPVLEKIKKEAEDREQGATQISRFGFVNAVLREVMKYV
ncbi:zf-TFIIB domain-containing protein [Verrucomicrobiota bacterium]